MRTHALVSIVGLAVVLSGLSGCSYGNGGASRVASSTGVLDSHLRAKRVIRSHELRALRGEVRISTVEDALRHLWPDLLQLGQVRAGRERLLVYLDGTLIGGVEMLSTVPIHGVTEVCLLDARTATTRFGRPLPFGAIAVVVDPMVRWPRSRHAARRRLQIEPTSPQPVSTRRAWR